MNESVKELIAIGASVGAHCQPCLKHHIQAARDLGVPEYDIREAVAMGHKVEKGAMLAMKKFTGKLLEDPAAGPSRDMQPENEAATLTIYDPAMCCSSGVCGPSVDPVLAQFAGTLKQVAGRSDIRIERYNLGQQSQAFVDNETVKAMLKDGGEKQLPFIFIDGQLWLKGRYPSKEELMDKLNITPGPVLFPGAAPADDAPCCDQEGCC